MTMRKRVGKVVLLIILIVVLIICSCLIYSLLKKRDKVSDEPSHTGMEMEWEQGAYHPNDLMAPEDPANENLAGMLQEKAAGVVVQIRAEDRLGSGVIWMMNDEETIVVTAAHVIEGSHKIEVTLVDGSVIKSGDDITGEKQWRIVLSETADLGFLILPTEQIPDEAVTVCRYAAVDKEAFDSLKSGDILIVMGSGEEVAGNAYEGSLTDPWIYMTDYSQYMMLAHTYAKPGMSGGGVFNMYGQFVGILSGADDSGNLAVVPLSIILTEAMNL